MQLGLIGLGKMGGNMRERIRRAGHTVVGYDRNPDLADVHSLAELVSSLEGPRVVWVMVPAGAPTQTVRGAASASTRASRLATSATSGLRSKPTTS